MSKCSGVFRRDFLHPWSCFWQAQNLRRQHSVYKSFRLALTLSMPPVKCRSIFSLSSSLCLHLNVTIAIKHECIAAEQFIMALCKASLSCVGCSQLREAHRLPYFGKISPTRGILFFPYLDIQKLLFDTTAVRGLTAAVSCFAFNCDCRGHVVVSFKRDVHLQWTLVEQVQALLRTSCSSMLYTRAGLLWHYRRSLGLRAWHWTFDVKMFWGVSAWLPTSLGLFLTDTKYSTTAQCLQVH